MRYQTYAPYPVSVLHPACPECGCYMMLDRVEPDKPEYGKRTFECPRCQHSEIEIVKFK